MDEMIKRNLSRDHNEPPEYYAAGFEKRKVAIVGISEGAGATFLTMCIARAMADAKTCKPTVVELGHGSIYDSIGLDKRFTSREFFCFHHTLSQGKPIKGKKNMDEGINWVVKSPEENMIILDAYEKLMLVNSAVGNLVLCDLSSCMNDMDSQNSTFRLLQDMDSIFVVIDPMPSKMLNGYKLLQQIKMLEAKERPIIYILNKFNNGINKKEMLSFLKVRKPIVVPLIHPEELYKAEYNCKNPYSIPEVKKQMEKSLREILLHFNSEL